MFDGLHAWLLTNFDLWVLMYISKEEAETT